MKASAAKRGRNPRFPYVPVIVSGGYYDMATKRWVRPRSQNTNTRNAYATREEAVAFAQRWIDEARLRDATA